MPGTETPPAVEAGGVAERAFLLGGNVVGAGVFGRLEGLDLEPHLLTECAGDEAADAVSLMPTSA